MANVTRRDVLTKAKELDVFSAEEREVLDKMLKSLDKKSTGPSKATIANIGVKNQILEVADGKTAKAIADELGYSTAKVAGLLRKLVEDGKVEKCDGAKAKDAPTYKAIEGAEPYEEPKAE